MPPTSAPQTARECDGSLIEEIVRATSLPPQYLRQIQVKPVGETRHAKLHRHEGIIDWNYAGGSLDVPVLHSTVAELRNTSVVRLLGQAMLIRDPLAQTAMVSIAEAAYVQLNGLHELLECILVAIKRTADSDLTDEWLDFELKWEAVPEDELAALYPEGRPQSKHLKKRDTRCVLFVYLLSNLRSDALTAHI